jgi:hypothetical protein
MINMTDMDIVGAAVHLLNQQKLPTERKLSETESNNLIHNCFSVATALFTLVPLLRNIGKDSKQQG